MILEFSITNFLSFKEEVTLSFEATKDDNLEEFHVVEVAPGVRILKLGIVYGANASGKSNVVNAFEFLKNIWFNTPENKDQGTRVIPFLLDKLSQNEPTEFKLVFYIDQIKHNYLIKLDEASIIYESLFYYPGTQPAEIFTRELKSNVSTIRFGNKIKISSIIKDEISVKCLPNMSVFSAYNKVNANIPELELAANWIKDQFMEVVEPDTRYLEKYTENLIKEDATVKEYVLNFLIKADFNIKNIKTKLEEKKIPAKLIDVFADSDLPVEERERLRKEKTIKITHTIFSHRIIDELGKEGFFDLPDSLQSQGTLRTMGLAGVISQAIKRNAFVAIDEIESSLHPRLVEFIIESFLKQSNKSQLLVTTHNDGLLEEEDLLRKDNIWFTNKKLNGSTEVYSLSDFKGVNRISSLQKAYKYGKFGAIPNI